MNEPSIVDELIRERKERKEARKKARQKQEAVRSREVVEEQPMRMTGENERRARMITEFLGGMNPCQAMAFAGFPDASRDAWLALRRDTDFCNQLLAMMEAKLAENPWGDQDVERGLWERAWDKKDPPQSRVAALRELAKIRGIDKREDRGAMVAIHFDLTDLGEE